MIQKKLIKVLIIILVMTSCTGSAQKAYDVTMDVVEQVKTVNNDVRLLAIEQMQQKCIRLQEMCILYEGKGAICDLADECIINFELILYTTDDNLDRILRMQTAINSGRFDNIAEAVKLMWIELEKLLSRINSWIK